MKNIRIGYEVRLVDLHNNFVSPITLQVNHEQLDEAVLQAFANRENPLFTVVIFPRLYPNNIIEVSNESGT